MILTSIITMKSNKIKKKTHRVDSPKQALSLYKSNPTGLVYYMALYKYGFINMEELQRLRSKKLEKLQEKLR